MIEGNSPGSHTFLKYGMVGGGEGSFIGDVHRHAINLDNKAKLVSGCFSRDYNNTLQTGKLLGISKENLYATYKEMAVEEGKKENGIDFVSIVSPNNTHFSIIKVFLENGINVVCDKPLTHTSAQADELRKLAEKKELLVCITYTYSGYPMVKHAREMIKNGEIGKIRFVNAEYPQEWMSELTENKNNKQAKWRTDPAQSGISNCVGDIGSHIENTVAYITDLNIEKVCARLDIFGEGRKLDDNATIMVNYSNGAKGLYWCSQIAVGHDNGLKIRVIGTEGSIEFEQENPNYLRVANINAPLQIISRGRDPLHPGALSVSRIPAGHPEGFIEAFANIYSVYIDSLIKKKKGYVLTKEDLDYQQLEEGLNGVRFIEKCVESSQKGAVWIDF